MGFLGSLLQAAVDTVSLPIDALSDAITGGEDQRTKRKVSQIGEGIGDAFSELGDGDLL